MINVASYIRMILSKKGWSNVRLKEEINKIEVKLGDKRTNVTDISNYLNGIWEWIPNILAKWELALGLKEGALVNMVSPPITKEGKNELKEVIERLRNI